MTAVYGSGGGGGGVTGFREASAATDSELLAFTSSTKPCSLPPSTPTTTSTSNKATIPTLSLTYEVTPPNTPLPCLNRTPPHTTPAFEHLTQQLSSFLFSDTDSQQPNMHLTEGMPTVEGEDKEGGKRDQQEVQEEDEEEEQLMVYDDPRKGIMGTRSILKRTFSSTPSTGSDTGSTKSVRLVPKNWCYGPHSTSESKRTWWRKYSQLT